MNKDYVEIKAKYDFKLLKSLKEYQEWTKVERLLGVCLTGVDVEKLKRKCRFNEII